MRQRGILAGYGAEAAAADEGLSGRGTRALYSFLCQAAFPDITAKDADYAFQAASGEGAFEELLSAMLNLGCSLKRRRTSLRKARRWELPALFKDAATNRIWLVIATPDGVRFFSEDGQEGSPDLAAPGSFVRILRSRRTQADFDEQRQHTGQSWLGAVFARLTATRRGLVLISLLGAALTVAIPALIAAYYETVFQNGDTASAGWFALAFALVVAARLSVSAVRLHGLAWLAARMHFLVTRSTFRHLLMLPASLSARLEARDQAARVRSFENVSEFITSPLAPVLIDLPVAALAVLALATISPKLALILAVGCLAHVGIFLAGRSRMRVLTSQLAERATRLQSLLIETFSKRETIRECNLQDRWPSLHYGVIVRAQKAEAAAARLLSITEAVGNLVTTITFAAIIVTSTFLVGESLVGPAAQIAAVVMTGFALGPTQALTLAVSRLEQCRKVIQQINEFMDFPAESNFEAAARKLPRICGNIRFNNVSLRPGEGSPLLMGLEAEISAGQIIGICGAAGTGKTLLLNTIQGMIRPAFGNVFIEGVNIGQLPLRDLRNAIAYVPQNPQLLPVSLRDNLALANPHANDQQIARALRLVGLTELADDIPSLETRFDLPFAPDCPWRFSLAQALIVGSDLILIDEIPNAVINAGLGKIVQEVIVSARGRKTVIFVSQRSDLLSHADIVMNLRYGRQPELSDNRPASISRAA